MRIYDDVLVVVESHFGVYSRVTKERLPFNRDPALNNYPNQPVTHRYGECFWLADDWSGNFGHFLMDTAHTLLEWRPGQSVLCNDNVAYIRELVALWRPTATLVPLVKKDRVYHVNRLFQPTPVFGHSAGEFPPYVVQFFKEFKCKAPVVTEPVPLVMITRRDAVRRKIANENELVEGMVGLGFVPYEFSKLSLVERISLVRQARCVFSHCGASAANYAWIHPGATTITLYSASLHGEETHNSLLTRVMGGVPYVMDEHGQSFSGQINASDDYSSSWTIPSVPVILDEVKRIVEAI